MKTIQILVFSLFLPFISWTQGISSTTPPKLFDGFYAGANAGIQNLFGGSFVDGKDILAQESRFVSELSLGFRKQFAKERFLVGVELQFGFTDGDLTHDDPTEPLFITYKNNTQWGYGLIAGITLGKQKQFLTYGYLNETKRKFDVTITDEHYTFDQTDKQGMLKYGLGLEAQVHKQIHVRASIGGLRVDFGTLETNIEVEDKLDFIVGVVYQF